MARYSYADLKIEFDNSGGSLVDMSAYITQVNGIEKEALEEEITAAGDDDQRHAAIGIAKVGDITLGGPFDDTATTGPHAIFNAIGNTTTRTLKYTFGGSVTQSVETVIVKYSIKTNRNGLTMFEAVLRPTGAVS